jgi:hypothetical protein
MTMYKAFFWTALTLTGFWSALSAAAVLGVL